MPVLINAKNLVFGNGDLFLSPTGVGGLPTEAQYKTALAAGTLGALANNVGAVKGTAEVILTRTEVDFEVGVPQEIADQTISKEECVFKCSLAELTLVQLQQQLGLPTANYSSVAAGVTNVSLEAHNNVQQDLSVVLAFAPVLSPSTSPTATAPVVRNASATSTVYVENTDYVVDYTNGYIIPRVGGAISNGTDILVTYNYNALASEQLTMGGQNSINQVALRFFHPYSWGGVIYCTISKANPIGSITLPFEEINYSLRVVEFKAIADFTQPVGSQLVSINRDIPPGPY